MTLTLYAIAASVLWVALAVAVLLLGLLARKQRRADSDLSVPEPSAKYRQTPPLTEPEQVLYWRLVQALPECVILAQVSFSRFMKPETDGKVPLPQYIALQNRLSQKTVDYLVCLRSFGIVAAIELDDSSHHARRDEKRDELLESAGVRVIRMRVSAMPTVEQIRTRFTHEYSEVQVSLNEKR